MKPSPSAIPATLTQAELTRESIAAAFALAEPDHDPLPLPYRLPCEWDGAQWTEFNPATGEIIASGTVEEGAI